jgi:hypothetical protein
MRIAIGAVCAALAIVACGGSSPGAWKALRRVTVTVAQPGLPPPYGAGSTTSFTTPAQLTRVTSLLNAHHIAQASPSSSNSGCAGGYQIAITISPRNGRQVRLSAYRCANQTTGDVSGDLVGFLGALGFKV